jgi:hypothetical protein
MSTQHKKRSISIIIGIIILIILYVLKDSSYFLRGLGFVFAIFLFYLVDVLFKIRFKKSHYLLIILISASGILLSPLYFVFPIYDKILHLLVPMLIGILVFFLVNKLKTKFSIKLLITIAIIISLISLFEMGEYILDQSFNLKLQGVFLRDHTGVAKLKIIMDRNDDTMIDLMLGTAGAIIFVLIQTGIYYSKKLKKK